MIIMVVVAGVNNSSRETGGISIIVIYNDSYGTIVYRVITVMLYTV